MAVGVGVDPVTGDVQTDSLHAGAVIAHLVWAAVPVDPTTGKGVTERMVTLGGSTNLSTCNPPSIAIRMGRLNNLAAVTASTTLDKTTAAGQRYAISRSQLVTGLQAMV